MPCYDNIFMEELEENLLSGNPCKPLAYYRHIDDILIIFWIVSTISPTLLINNTVTSYSLQTSPPRQSTSLMSPLNYMEATFPPKHTLNQQTHTHYIHTTVSTQVILNNLLYTVNFYVSSTIVLMKTFFTSVPSMF